MGCYLNHWLEKMDLRQTLVDREVVVDEDMQRFLLKPPSQNLRSGSAPRIFSSYSSAQRVKRSDGQSGETRSLRALGIGS